MKKHTTSTAIPTYALKAEALASMSASFERFCLAAGLETLSEMLEQDATVEDLPTVIKSLSSPDYAPSATRRLVLKGCQAAMAISSIPASSRQTAAVSGPGETLAMSVG